MGSKSLIFGECATEVRKRVQPESVNKTRYIGLEHIEKGTLHLGGYDYAGNVSSAKTEFSKGDILFGKLRPYFRKVVCAPFDGICSTDLWVVRSKNGIDQKFLYYWMASQEFVNFCIQGSEGTKMPRAKWNYVSRHQIPFFTKYEQGVIAHVLESFDDKIELNNRINETLEAMARTLFKSWFVNFDPVIDNALAAGNNIPGEFEKRASIRRSLGSQVEVSSSLDNLPTPRPGMFFVYAILCDNGSVYIGKTDALKKCWDKHCSNRAANWTPLKLVHFEEYSSKEEADSRKKELKTARGEKWLKEKIKNKQARESVINKPLPQEIQKLFPAEFEYTKEMGWIPKGWGVSTVGEEVEIVGGGTPSTKDESFWLGGTHAFCNPKDMSALPGKVLLGTERLLTHKGVAKSNSGLLPSGTVLMSSKASIGYLAITDVPVVISRNIIAMLRQKSLNELFLMCWASCNMGRIMARVNGSVLLEITKRDFKSMPFLVPEQRILEAFNNHTDTICKRLISCTRTNKTLSALRDTLLPKLLSGKIRIPEAEKLIEKGG